MRRTLIYPILLFLFFSHYVIQLRNLQGIYEMELRRTFLFLCLFLFSFLTPAYSADTQQGIAFIHGTKDHTDDAFGGYWKKNFIKDVAKGLPNPANHVVVHCDFDQYMWHERSAICVADQLLAFIKEKKHQ